MPSADGPPAFRRHRIQTIAPFVSERTAVLAPMLYTAIRVTGDDHRVTDQAETNDREHAESDLRGPVTGELEPPVQPHADRLREPWSRNLNLGHQEHPIWHSTRPFRNLGHIDQELYRSPIPPRGSSPPDPAASLRRDPASPFLLSPNSAPPVRLPVPPRRFGNPANNRQDSHRGPAGCPPVPPPISNQISRDFRGTLRKEQVSPRSESAHRLASDPYEVEAPVDFGAARGGRVSTVVPLSLRVFGSVSLARGATRGSMTGCGPDRTRRRPATD